MKILFALIISLFLYLPHALAAEEGGTPPQPQKELPPQKEDKEVADTKAEGEEEDGEESKECDCEEIKTVTNAFELADVVFAGKVINIRRAEPGKEDKLNTSIAFEIYQYWKGDIRSRTILYRSELFEPQCNFPFEKGKEYLVFADQTSLDVYRKRYVPPGGKIINATKCSRTKLLDDAEDETKTLGAGNIPD